MARRRRRGQAGRPSARGHLDRRRGDRTRQRGRRGLDREGQAVPRRGVAAGHERPCHRRGAARGRPARRRAPGRGGDPCPRPRQGSRAACRDHLADLSVVGPAGAGRRSGRVPGPLARAWLARAGARGPARRGRGAAPGGPTRRPRLARHEHGAEVRRDEPRTSRGPGDRRARDGRADEPRLDGHRAAPDPCHAGADLRRCLGRAVGAHQVPRRFGHRADPRSAADPASSSSSRPCWRGI